METVEIEKEISFSIGKRNKNFNNHWEQLNIDQFKIVKPTIICFGGNMTVSEKDANAMCKIADHLLSKNPKYGTEYSKYYDIDIVGVSYGKDKGKEQGHLSKEEVSEFVDKVFIRLCKDDEGNDLPVDQVKKNFGNVTFLSHCYGARAINEIIVDMYKKMVKEGYNKEDVNEFFRQMNSVSYAPMLAIYNVNNLAVYTGNDELLTPPGNFKCMDLYESNYKGVSLFKEDENTISLYTDRMTNGKEHGMQVIEAETPKAQAVSSIMSRVLTSSIVHSICNNQSEKFISNMDIDQVYEIAQEQLKIEKEKYIKNKKTM